MHKLHTVPQLYVISCYVRLGPQAAALQVEYEARVQGQEGLKGVDPPSSHQQIHAGQVSFVLQVFVLWGI